MGTPIRTSGKAVAAFLAGLLSVACGFLAIARRSDLFLVGVVLSSGLAIVLGVRSWVEVGRNPGSLRGKAFAGWGATIPLVGLALGFLLVPAT